MSLLFWVFVFGFGIIGKVSTLPTPASLSLPSSASFLDSFPGYHAAASPNGEDQEMFDQILQANSEFDTDLIEGDIREDEEEDEEEYGRQKRSAVRSKQKLWPGGILPYKMSGGLDYSVKRYIHEAMKQLQCETCIKFRPKQTSDSNYLYFYNGDGCWSWVGRHFGKQKVSLSSHGCKSKGIAMHEMIHALGFWHEQARPDRDNYIKIDMKNVKSSAKSNFKKRTEKEAQFFTEYDLDSIMHYSSKAFSRNGKATIIPWKNVTHEYRFKLGQRDHLTKRDIEGINILYQCKVNGCGETVRFSKSSEIHRNMTEKSEKPKAKKIDTKTQEKQFGSWLPWSAWTKCDQYCRQTRSRKCNQTEPLLCGNNHILSVENQQQACKSGPYCEMKERYSQWNRYG